MTSLVVEAKPWPLKRPPRAILAVRLQCLGDLVGVLPYLLQVREACPEARLDLLTRDLYAGFVDTLPWIDNAVYLGRSWTDRQALLSAMPLLPRLVLARYEVVIDLQGSPLTRRLRTILRPAAWVHFDRYSPRPGFERIRDTVERVGIGSIVHRSGIGWFDTTSAEARLRAAGWKPEESLVLLNPGSHIPTRQWPTDRWAELAAAFVRDWPDPVRILLLGIDRIKHRTDLIAAVPGLPVIDLVSATGLSELGPLLSLVQLTVTEDGGLSHLSTALGVPTLALLPGGSADVWVRHVGPHVADMVPSGVECAPCLDTVCRYGDMRCSRWSVREVFAAAHGLWERAPRENARGPSGRVVG
ncbi:MAG TPA: glycosyltransferase family 9 protein [Methylomirabilota bacterium]|nr:glycosyltransferase family 9 protein [Methylomirabilota bacterium]